MSFKTPPPPLPVVLEEDIEEEDEDEDEDMARTHRSNHTTAGPNCCLV